MPTHPQRQDNREHFDEKYARQRPEAVLGVERGALGTDMGVNGYTTAAEAELLVGHVNLTAGGRLLDLGSGRGWPGLHLATTTGCTLFATDIPLDALRAARANAMDTACAGRTQLLAADGRHIPFGAGVFDAVTHADVLC